MLSARSTLPGRYSARTFLKVYKTEFYRRKDKSIILRLFTDLSLLPTVRPFPLNEISEG